MLSWRYHVDFSFPLFLTSPYCDLMVGQSLGVPNASMYINMCSPDFIPPLQVQDTLLGVRTVLIKIFLRYNLYVRILILSCSLANPRSFFQTGVLELAVDMSNTWRGIPMIMVSQGIAMLKIDVVQVNEGTYAFEPPVLLL